MLCFALVTLVIYAEVLFASFGRATSPTAAHAKGATLSNLELPFGQSANASLFAGTNPWYMYV